MGAECPPAMPVTGLHRTAGLAAFVGALEGHPLVYSSCPFLLGQKHLVPSGFFHVLALDLLLSICSFEETRQKLV